MFHKDRRRGYGDNTIITKLSSFNGMCDFKAYPKWEDTMEWVFDRTFYSEQKKVQLAASTFVGDAAEWWDEERHCRRFYGDRPLDTWYEMREMLRKRIRQNIDEEFRVGMDKIESLFSQWKESSPNPNTVCNVGAETPMKDDFKAPEHVEIAKVDETLPEDHEDKEMVSMEFDHDFLVEEDKVKSQSEIVLLFPCKYVIPNVHTSPTLVLVFSKFIKFYHVSMRAKKKSERENVNRKIIQWGKKRVIELLREKKRKKVRNGKRVKEKWFVLDVLQVTMARI